MKVSLDTNVWEAVFDPNNRSYSSLRSAFEAGVIEGFVCAAGFRIEAVRKSDRLAYFARAKSDFRFEGFEERDGQTSCKMSFGPADHLHPGLPEKQSVKLALAIGAGLKLMRGMNWMGLPSPTQIAAQHLYAGEPPEGVSQRELRQAELMQEITDQNVGRAGFEALGGWNFSPGNMADAKKFQKACAEWSDAELVAAHIAYRHDILCTNDRAKGAGQSIFDCDRRSWLLTRHGVEFRTLDELIAEVT